MNLIYSSMTVHNDAGTEAEVKVLLALYDETAGKLTTAVDLLNDNGTLKQFTYTGYSFGFAKFAEIPNPLIIITGAIPNDVPSLTIHSFYNRVVSRLSLILISEPTRLLRTPYAVFCLHKKQKKHR